VPPLSTLSALPLRLVALTARALAPRANLRSFGDGLSILSHHWRLILEMAREDLAGRYRGQMIGSVWALIHPVALTAVYLFMFGVVFAQRIGGTREMPLDYTAYMLAGLIPWLTFQTAMVTSVNSVSGNAQLVKQFIFPIEVLPARDVVSATVTWFVGMAGLFAYVLSVERTVMITWVLLPLAFALQMLAMLGVGFLLSALNVFVRDLKDFLNLFTLVALFLMPVVYLPGWVPPLFKPLIWLNPFTYMAWVYQDAIYFGRIDHPVAWVVMVIGAPLVFAWGARVFRATKPMFSTVL
jgi:lipopolysaccharide transport system permease protein